MALAVGGAVEPLALVVPARDHRERRRARQHGGARGGARADDAEAERGNREHRATINFTATALGFTATLAAPGNSPRRRRDARRRRRNPRRLAVPRRPLFAEKCTQPDTASGGVDEHLREYAPPSSGGRCSTAKCSYCATSSAASGSATSWSCRGSRCGSAWRHAAPPSSKSAILTPPAAPAACRVQRAALFDRRLLSPAAQRQLGVDARTCARHPKPEPRDRLEDELDRNLRRRGARRRGRDGARVLLRGHSTELPRPTVDALRVPAQQDVDRQLALPRRLPRLLRLRGDATDRAHRRAD